MFLAEPIQTRTPHPPPTLEAPQKDAWHTSPYANPLNVSRTPAHPALSMGEVRGAAEPQFAEGGNASEIKASNPQIEIDSEEDEETTTTMTLDALYDTLSVSPTGYRTSPITRKRTNSSFDFDEDEEMKSIYSDEMSVNVPDSCYDTTYEQAGTGQPAGTVYHLQQDEYPSLRVNMVNKQEYRQHLVELDCQNREGIVDNDVLPTSTISRPESQSSQDDTLASKRSWNPKPLSLR